MDLVKALKMDQELARNIDKALDWLRREFARAGIPFAVVGGLALRRYGYRRFTEDIDILTTKEGLDRIHREVIGRGLVPRFSGARKGLRQTEHNVKVDVITEGEHAGSADSPVLYPSPESDAFVERDGILIPKLESLVEFKIASGVWGSRGRDFGDVEELIKANRLTRRFAAKLIAPLRPKFLELLRNARREKTLE